MKYLHILFLASALGLFSCGGASEPSHDAEGSSSSSTNDVIQLSEEQIKKNGIEIGKLEALKMARRIDCTGSVEVPPQNLATIHSPVKGFVRSVNAIQGDHVHKGEVLAVLDHPEYARMQRELLESKAKMDMLQKEFDRKKELLGNDAVSKREFELADAELKGEKARFEGSRNELLLSGFAVERILSTGTIQSSVSILSPFNGYVSRLGINIGKLMNPEDLIAEVVNTDHLHLELHVYAKDIPYLREEQKIAFTLAGSDSLHYASIYLVGKTIDPENNTVMVHAHFDDESVYTAGTFVNGNIMAGEKEVLTVPLTGLVKEGAHDFIFIRLPEGFKKVHVETGFRDGKNVEIQSIEGYDKTVDVVVKGAYYLQGGGEEE